MKKGLSLTLAAGVWLLLSLLTSILLFGQESSAPQSESATTERQTAVVAESVELPDSPGAVQSQNTSGTPAANGQQMAPPPNPAPQTQQPPEQDQTNQPQTQPPPAEQPGQAPVGTAAARTANPSGVAASEPAGSAIAPAKQKRTRIILISMAAVLGAAAAVGIVAGLSAGSPSRPPGTH